MWVDDRTRAVYVKLRRRYDPSQIERAQYITVGVMSAQKSQTDSR